MNYKEARVYLDEVSKYGSVLGLDPIRELLGELGNPQEHLKFIHIAGTNGKGSILACASEILTAAGYKTGRYVSPTVIDYLERIQVDGRWISEEEFTPLVMEVKDAVTRMEKRGLSSPTVFEVETAIAFLYFRNKNCDFVVLETGLGGLLDATNIVENTVAAVFATISRDHMAFLGDTIHEIAVNKAGIIKNGCAVVTSMQNKEAMEVLEEKALSCGSIVYVEDQSKIEMIAENYKEQIFTYKEWKELKVPLAGRYQMNNAVTVLGLVRALREKGYVITDEAVRTGFLNVKWPGRFTCIGENPVFIVDGAHNEDAALRLRESVEHYFTGKKLIFIMGVFKDKEYEKIAKIMAPLAHTILTVNLPDENRTLSAGELSKTVEVYCGHVETVGEIEDAVQRAFALADPDDVILSFGSLSYLGRVMKAVMQK